MEERTYELAAEIAARDPDVYNTKKVRKYTALIQGQKVSMSSRAWG